jgi:hypothetical protein
VLQQLTPVQEQVLFHIAAGETITGAAAMTGIHRNSVSHWMRCSALFREALSDAHLAQAHYWREQAQRRVDAAYAVMDQILANPNAPASVRARIARDIIQSAKAPQAQPEECSSALREHYEKSLFYMSEGIPALPATPEKAQILHNFAQADSQSTDSKTEPTTPHPASTPASSSPAPSPEAKKLTVVASANAS